MLTNWECLIERHLYTGSGEFELIGETKDTVHSKVNCDDLSEIWNQSSLPLLGLRFFSVTFCFFPLPSVVHQNKAQWAGRRGDSISAVVWWGQRGVLESSLSPTFPNAQDAGILNVRGWRGSMPYSIPAVTSSTYSSAQEVQAFHVRTHSSAFDF